MKKIILNLLVLFILNPIIVFASSNTEAMVNGKYYDNLEDAIKDANSGDTVKIFSNVSLDEALIINKEINLNLNGNNISSKNSVFQVKDGTLNVFGKGTIKEREPNYGAIRIIGSTVQSEEKYSSVDIGKDVVLEGWAGLFITHDSSKSYGVNVNFSGKINAVSDINGDSGIGIYVNGNIKDRNNSPVVNILDNAVINSDGIGLYIAGYSNFNIKKASITGYEAGIGIKSGILNIDGATINAIGVDNTPTEGYNNGMKPSGTALQIESNNGYAGGMKINISSGKFVSKNSYVIYEYIGKGNSTLVDEMEITGGTFISERNKDTIIVSSSFQNKHGKFITGGKYSSNPKEFLKSGYSANMEDDLYIVSLSTFKEVFSETNDTNGIFKNIVIFGLVLSLLLLIYINRIKILSLIKK